MIHQAERNLQAATEARRAAQASGDQTAIASALRVERIARDDLGKFQRAAAPAGTRWSEGFSTKVDFTFTVEGIER